MLPQCMLPTSAAAFHDNLSLHSSSGSGPPAVKTLAAGQGCPTLHLYDSPSTAQSRVVLSAEVVTMRSWWPRNLASVTRFVCPESSLSLRP